MTVYQDKILRDYLTHLILKCWAVGIVLAVGCLGELKWWRVLFKGFNYEIFLFTKDWDQPNTKDRPNCLVHEFNSAEED